MPRLGNFGKRGCKFRVRFRDSLDEINMGSCEGVKGEGRVDKNGEELFSRRIDLPACASPR